MFSVCCICREIYDEKAPFENKTMSHGFCGLHFIKEAVKNARRRVKKNLMNRKIAKIELLKFTWGQR